MTSEVLIVLSPIKLVSDSIFCFSLFEYGGFTKQFPLVNWFSSFNGAYFETNWWWCAKYTSFMSFELNLLQIQLLYLKYGIFQKMHETNH